MSDVRIRTVRRSGPWWLMGLCLPMLGCSSMMPWSGSADGTGAVSGRQLAADVGSTLPPPGHLTPAPSPAPATSPTAPATLVAGQPSHAAVSERIGPPLSPGAAMGGAVPGQWAPASPSTATPAVTPANPPAATLDPAAVMAANPTAAGPAAITTQAAEPTRALPTAVLPPAIDGDMGAGIRAGQCWAQLVVEPVARRDTVRIVTEDGATRLLVQPPQLRTENRAVVVKEEAQTYRVEPPRFRQVTERVQVKEEVRRLVVVPAVYEERQETVQVESARVVLENCRASAQRAAGSNVASSQAKCVRELPPRLQTVNRRVLVQPETTREEITPPVYATITKWVLEEPARAIPEVLPASTRQLPLTQVAQPAAVQSQTVPPTTTAVRVTQHEGMPQLVWRRALCESDAQPATVTALQKALRDQGMDVGGLDGKLGRRTMAALMDYQRREGLALGLVTYETLSKLGVTAP